jgi:galactokinase/galacturonokinase
MQLHQTYCPYRVCPLGAHSDHQFGKVTGFALDYGIRINYTPTPSEITITSHQFEGAARFTTQYVPQRQGDWADMLRGATLALREKTPISHGLTAEISGSLPIGGLSSSAAVILAYLNALCRVNVIRLTPNELIDTALWAENEYVGVSVGKLDQSCEVYCRKDHLLYLDTKDGSYENIPRSPNCPPFEIMILFSGLERKLAGSAFNMRVDEVKAAGYSLLAYAGMNYGKFADVRLRNIPCDVFESYKNRLPESFRKRATHFYTEFERVEKGAEAWKRGDLTTFGKLIFDSGWSSIHNYETGGEQLIRLYEIMCDTDGIFGGRFSGAGFSGCCMAIIDPSKRNEIKDRVTQEYLKTYPSLAGSFSVHFCSTADGVANQQAQLAGEISSDMAVAI